METTIRTKNAIKCGEYYNTHREERKAKSRQYNLNHIEEKRARDRKYYKEHKETINERGKSWRKEHPEYVKNYNDSYHNPNGIRKMEENKCCPHYLGIHIAERILSKYFEDIEQMPFGNKGYDFICKNGFKIDVKSACIDKINQWGFNIAYNTTADYFLCIAFDDRENLNPLHIWLMPGKDINTKQRIAIPNTNYGITKWSEYERSLDKVIECCNKMK